MWLIPLLSARSFLITVRLRYRDQPLFPGFFMKAFGDQRIDDIGLDILRKALLASRVLMMARNILSARDAKMQVVVVTRRFLELSPKPALLVKLIP
jgi:hypothetical protein